MVNRVTKAGLGGHSYNADQVAKLAAEILRHKKSYYSGAPTISDAQYDALEDELRGMHPEHPVLQIVGAPLFRSEHSRKVEHAKAMLSLAKTYDVDELLKWVDSHPVMGMYKIDGVSLSVVYESGRIKIAKTRGNGRIGEDVSEKIVWVSDVLPKISETESLEIRGEVVCTEEQFLHLASEMQVLGLERPTSPRNIVAGLLGRKDHIDLARFFNFFAFDVMYFSDGKRFAFEHQKFKWLETHGFQTPFGSLLNSQDEVKSYLDQVLAAMETGHFGIDGAVFSYDDLRLHEELGVTAHHPRYKMSFKWHGSSAEAVIERIEWFTSRRGVVTPVAVIKPVELSGATISNVTLHNAAHVRTYDLKSGDAIEIVRSGEVIPKFLRVIQSAKGTCLLPESCPSCKHTLRFDDVRLVCENRSLCPAQLSGRILNWINCLDIEDLSEKRLQQMLDVGLVKGIPDLYRLSMGDLLELPQTKEKMARKLLQNINATREPVLPRFLFGLGIEGAGLTSWEKLVDHFGSLQRIMAAGVQDICEVDGFAERSAALIVEGLKQQRGLIEELQEVGVKPRVEVSHVDENHPLFGKQFVITGALSMPREKVEAMIKAVGAKASSSVSKNTFALITNEQDSQSSKMKKARQLGVEVWSEGQLLKKLN